MDIDLNNSDDIKMDTGFKRYTRLHCIIEEIASHPLSRTHDWYDEHSLLLHTYQCHFESFVGIHPEITDPDFRKKCAILEELITKLLLQYDTHRWFSLYDYSRFNETMISVCDTVFNQMDDKDENDLSKMFNGLTV